MAKNPENAQLQTQIQKPRFSYATRHDSTLHEYALRRFMTAADRDAWAGDWAPYGETREAVTAADARTDFPHAFAHRTRDGGE